MEYLQLTLGVRVYLDKRLASAGVGFDAAGCLRRNAKEVLACFKHQLRACAGDTTHRTTRGGWDRNGK